MLLFVYGTLRSEFDNRYAAMLRGHAELLGSASVTGSIFHVGDYPGFRPEPPGQVYGELYRLNEPTRVLAELDEWEGSEFRRVAIRVSTGQGAWIYEYQAQPPVSARIASGDFCAL